MKNIVIVSAGALPVPPVKGGAVECLIDFILNENEKKFKFKITVISIWNENAVKLAKHYKNTSFEHVKINDRYNKLYQQMIRIINKLFLCKKSLYKLYFAKSIKIINKKNYDYIIVENCVEFIPYVMKKSFNDKVLLHVHNDYLNADTKNAKKMIDSCYKVITVSEFIKTKVLTLGQQYNNKVCVLKNCTDTNKFNKKLYYDFRKSFREKNNISENDVVIMFSGRIHQTKGIKELILAFSKVKNNNCKVLIVGSSWYGGNDKTDYVKQIEELSYKIHDKIIFTGFIPFNEMPKIHSVADIAVVPSICDDSAPLVVLEAMSSGLPLIVTDSGGILEYTNTDCAITVLRDEKIIDNLSNSLLKLINDRELRDRMGKYARIQAQQYNTINYYNDFIKILNQ